MDPKPIGEILAELRAAVPKVVHNHTDPCALCDDQRYGVETAMLSPDPTCHRCGVKHPRAPSCPKCGYAHYATRDYDKYEKGFWLCCYCNTVFHGTDDEWNDRHNVQHRGHFKAQREKFIALYHERYNTSMEEDV